VGIKEGTYIPTSCPLHVRKYYCRHRWELRRKTIGCRRYKAKEDFLKVIGVRQSYQKNQQVGGKRDNSDKKVYKPLEQYPRVLKVL
jgi:hypothetical protein